MHDLKLQATIIKQKSMISSDSVLNGLRTATRLRLNDTIEEFQRILRESGRDDLLHKHYYSKKSTDSRSNRKTCLNSINEKTATL